MNIDERKALIKHGVEKLAEKWLPGEPEIRSEERRVGKECRL